MEKPYLFYLSEKQAEELLSWKKEFEKNENWEDWCNEHKTTSKEIKKIINQANFLESTNLTSSELEEIFTLCKTGLGNRQMRSSLYVDNKLKVFNESLRLLLNEKEPLPKRFDEFIKLRNVAIWTASQFLSKWEPINYPLIATSGKKAFMDKVIINQLNHYKIKLAKKNALETYRINEHDYTKKTIDYLSYQQIFNEIREILGYSSYLEVQNLLWLVNENNRKLTKTKIISVKEKKTVQKTDKPQDDFYGKNDSSKTAPPERVHRHITIWKRNQHYINGLKKRYEGSCQFANCPIGTFMKRNGTPYAEAHHPKPLGEDGADELGNLMILCPTHHKMFHYANSQINEINGKTAIVTINGERNCVEFEPEHLELFKRFYQKYMI
jgi:predicted restriction endonuclease